MKKFVIVNGGCRGFIDDIQIVESDLTLETFVAEADAEARIAITDMFIDDFELSEEEQKEEADSYMEEFNIGGEVIGDIGVVVYGEETWEYIMEITEENEELITKFIDDDNLNYMHDFEEFFGLNW